MPNDERKSSEDLIREAQNRLRSPRTESSSAERVGGSAQASSPRVEPTPVADRPERQDPRATEPPSPPVEAQPPRRSWWIERRVLSWAMTVLVFVGWGFFSSLDDASRDGTGEVVSSGDLDVMTLQIGDCFNDPAELEDVVFNVAAVPCARPHDNEVFAVHAIAGVFGDVYPGEEALDGHGYEVCSGGLFDAYVGTPYSDSALDVFTFTPTDESWGQGDRQVVCALYRLDFSKLTRTARGSGL